MKKYLFLSVLIVIFCILFISCTSSEQLIENESAFGTSYPSANNTVDKGYPMTAKDAYPVLTESEENLKIGPKFTIDEPLTINSTSVTGIGPAGVPIILIDVSQMGEKLSETIINGQGNFMFSLNSPLIIDHTIGIQIGDLANTRFDPNDFISSPTYYDKPMIGIILDIANVQ